MTVFLNDFATLQHAFDNSGRLYDGDGRLNTWWSNATTQAFEEKSQCFINQYGNFTIDGPDNSKFNVNGKVKISQFFSTQKYLTKTDR